MCLIGKENFNQALPTISAVEIYINHQEGDILYEDFEARVLKVFENEVKQSDEYEDKLIKRIKSILDLLVKAKTIHRKGDLIIKNS